MKHLTHLNYINVVAKIGSIRQAAEQLNITSTALNRRILALEDELGHPIFERLPQGVRLNVAGELLIQHIRASMADLSKVTSQIADLSGVRRGHVTIAGGGEIIGTFLPSLIASYRRSHDGVSFEILRRAADECLSALQDFTCDIGIVFGPVAPSDYQILATIQLDVQAMFHHSHPLASKAEIRLADCLDYPVTLPTDNSGLRDILHHAQAKRGLTLPHIISSDSYEFMSHYCLHENAITFCLPLQEGGERPLDRELATRPFVRRDRMTGLLHIVQAKGRVLPVAAAKFAEEIVQYLSHSFPDDIT